MEVWTWRVHARVLRCVACVCVCVCGRLCSVSSRAAGAATQVRHQYSPGLVISLSASLRFISPPQPRRRLLEYSIKSGSLNDQARDGCH